MSYEYSKGYIFGQLGALEALGNEASKTIGQNIKKEFELLCEDLETPDEETEETEDTPDVTLPDYSKCKTLPEALDALKEASGLSHRKLQALSGINHQTWLSMRTEGRIPSSKNRDRLMTSFQIPERLFGKEA